MSDLFRRDLADLSEEVHMVDLRERALVTSRSLTRRRRVAIAAASFVGVLALAGTTVAFLPRGGSQPPGPGGTLTSSTTPSPEPSVTESREIATLAGIGVWESNPHPGSLPGTALFLTESAQGLTINRLAGGALESALVSSTRDRPCDGFASIAPDGSAVLYMAGGGEELAADVYVASLAGGPARRVAQQVRCGGSASPVWFPDSQAIWVPHNQAGQTTCGRVDVEAIIETPLDDDWCGDVAFGPGLDYRVSHDRVLTWDGAEVRPVPEVPDDQKVETWVGTIEQGVSADGRYVASTGGATDPSVVMDACCVMDTVTGQMVPLSALHGGSVPELTDLSAAIFLPDGGLVTGFETRGSPNRFTWHVLSGIGTVTATLENAPARMTALGGFVYLP